MAAYEASIVTARNESRGAVQRVRLSDFIEELSSGKREDLSPTALAAVLEMAQKVIDEQAIEIQHLRKQLFGRRSEKVSKDQLSLFMQTLNALVERQQDNKTPEEPKKEEPKKKGKKQNRGPLQPTRTEKIPVPLEERPCPVCGGERCTMGHVRSVVIEYTPAKLEVIEYLREKLVCRPCDGEITVAPPPRERVIERALPGPKMLSALVVNKAVDGLPLQRSRKIFRRAGVDIPVGTLSRWEGFAHQLLEPIVKLIRRKVLGADVINLDDTSISVRDPTEEDGVRSGHIWVFIGRYFDPGGDLSKTEEYVCYLYAPTWEAKHPEAFLAGSTALLQGDAYRGYERIAAANRGDGVGRLLAGCCMHARRPFVQALESQDPAAAFFVDRFQRIYQVEVRAKEEKLRADARLKLRKSESFPIMKEILERSKELSNLPLLKAMKTGTTYFVNQWDKLIVPFIQDGRLEIDNGGPERRLRPVAAGRKVWLFAGSRNGAERFADVLSLVSTADAAGVDAGSYLPSVIAAVDAWPQSRIDELLPHRWRQALEQMLAEQITQ